MYREIVTKAVTGKGKIYNNSEIIVNTGNSISRVLGCWVINHVYEPYYEEGNVFVKGNYDLHIWYGNNDDHDTLIHKQTVDYLEQFDVKMKKDENLNEKSELAIRCIKYPVCTGLDLNDGSISVKIEKELHLDIIGETVLKVEVSSNNDDWLNEDDINDINVNYMKG